jgi:hypothetical protein
MGRDLAILAQSLKSPNKSLRLKLIKQAAQTEDPIVLKFLLNFTAINRTGNALEIVLKAIAKQPSQYLIQPLIEIFDRANAFEKETIIKILIDLDYFNRQISQWPKEYAYTPRLLCFAKHIRQSKLQTISKMSADTLKAELDFTFKLWNR